MTRRLIQPNLIRRSLATLVGGGVYVSAGRLGGIRVLGGAVFSATQLSISFSGCVEITALTGVSVTVNGTPQTPSAFVSVNDRTWTFTVTTLAHGDVVVWSYDGTGGITDCRTGKDIGKQTVALSTVDEPVPGDGGIGWVRPADWPVLWSPAPGTEAIVGLFAVNNTADERVAMTMADAYTVDWGDGIVENFAAAAVAAHNYIYANLTSPVTVAGYKTAIILVTPQAGNSLTSVDITTPHTGAVPASTKWLDIEMRCPLATTFITGTATALKPLVQRILVREHNAKYWLANFRGCAALRSVPLFDTSSVTTFGHLFNGAAALATVPLFNAQNVTNMASMFPGCSALTAVPLFNTQNVTSMAGAFLSCTALPTVPLFNTQNVTTMQGMFNGASVLTAVPAFNMQAITIASTNFIVNTQVSSLLAAGMRFAWGINLAQLDAAALNTVFTNLGTASGVQVITITGNPGAATCDRTIATAKGWTVTG